MSKNEIPVAKAKGRPMLTWVGKKPLARVTAFPAKPHLGDRLAHASRLVRIQRRRHPRAHIAERTGARARVAHDHQRGVLPGPAFADVRAARFLAYGHQFRIAHDLARLEIALARRGLHTNPWRLAL